MRSKMGRKKKTSICIIDSQSVKNTDTAREKGYDGAKKISGIKRHIAVDTQGLPHAIHVSKASDTDRVGAINMLTKNKKQIGKTKKILVDGGYSGVSFANEVKKQIKETEVEVVKRNELHSFKVLPKRWIVERSFAWLEKCRRLWKNCERYIETSLQMVVLAFVRICLQRL